MGEISKEAFRFLREYIQRECGIALNEEKQYLVETRLRDLLQEEGISDYMTLYLKARDERGHRLRNKIIDAMTTNETLWFRDNAPFKVFEEVLLPKFEAEIREGKRRRIRVWSSACSTGQEPYSLVMQYIESARRSTVLGDEHLEVLATDISESAVKQAREGLYNSFALDRGLPDDLRRRYFEREGRKWRLSSELRDRIEFRQFNLQDSFALLGNFDIVLTRYVAIYFSDDFKAELFKKIQRLLQPEGHLFLGSSETLGNNAAGYEQVSHGRFLYYRSQPLSPGGMLGERNLVGSGTLGNER